jgi:hypothetical protein
MRYAVWAALLLLALFTTSYVIGGYNIPGVGEGTLCLISSAGMVIFGTLGVILLIVASWLFVKYILYPFVTWAATERGRCFFRRLHRRLGGYNPPMWAVMTFVCTLMWAAFTWLVYSEECGGG